MSNPLKNIKIYYKTQYQTLVSENTDFREKLKKAETKREILKKAAAYFANPNMQCNLSLELN